MSEHEFELREVPREPPEVEGERLQESVVGDVAAVVAAAANVGMFGYAVAASHSRKGRDDARQEADMVILRAQIDAEMRVLRTEMEAELRVLRAQGFGFGSDDYYGGFGVE